MAKFIIWNITSSNFDDNRFTVNNNGAHFSRYLGPHRIASWLRQHNFNTIVIDFANSMSQDQLLHLTKSFITDETEYIGVSSTFIKDSEKHPQWLYSNKSEIENEYPKIKWIVGGHKTHLFDESWIKFESFAEEDLSRFFNLTHSQFDIKTAGTVFTKNDAILPTEVLPIELGRGCKFKCKFCDYRLIGKKPGTYLRNFNIVEQEILYYYENFGVTRFSYVDDTVNESEEKVEALVSIAKRMPFELEWVGYCRADLIWRYPSMINSLRKSGMRSCFFGIESFETQSSKLIGKGWSGQHGKEFLLHLKKQWYPDINWEMGFIAGLPGQTPQQLRDDNKWLQDNDLNGYFIGLDLSSKKSEFAVNAEKYGFVFPHYDSYWENGIWNLDTANNIADEFRIQNQNRTTLAAFALSMFGGVGYDWKDMIHIRHVDFYTEEFYNKKKVCVENYVRNRSSFS
jgi:hypothetical protein